MKREKKEFTKEEVLKSVLKALKKADEEIDSCLSFVEESLSEDKDYSLSTLLISINISMEEIKEDLEK